MKKRPIPITIIAWLMIAGAPLTLLIIPFTMNNPMVKDMMSRSPIPVPVQYVMTFVGVTIGLVSGIAMLKGRNWARYLYVIRYVIGFITGFISTPIKAAMIPGFIVFIVMSYFLFNAKANEYFRSDLTENI